MCKIALQLHFTVYRLPSFFVSRRSRRKRRIVLPHRFSSLTLADPAEGFPSFRPTEGSGEISCQQQLFLKIFVFLKFPS